MSMVTGVSAVAQKGYTDMNVTGKTTFDITYTVDDTKAIMNYSGAEWYEACDNDFASNNTCVAAYADYTTAGESKVRDINGAETSPTNSGTLSIKNFGISTEEGVHEICIRNRDNADQYPGVGNVSDIVCKNIFYDKSGPEAEKIVINNANHWINKGEIPIVMTITDNRAGIDKITYVAGGSGGSVVIKEIDFSKPGNTITCERDTHPALGDGSYRCTVVAVLETDPNREYGDLDFTIYDKVGNSTNITECVGSYVDKSSGKGSCRIYYDLNKPGGNVEVKNDGNGLNDNTAHIEYHIKDEPAIPWNSPSGIEQVIVENPDGTNQQWIVDERDNPDPDITVDGLIQDYILNSCPAQVKFTIIDKAGNVTVMLTQPDLNCHALTFEEMRVVDVVNPKRYNNEHPYAIQEWVFGDNPQIYGEDGGWLGPDTPSVGNDYATLPSALSGANMTFDLTYKWDGDQNHTVSGYYTITVYNTTEGYESTWTGAINNSDFVDIGSNKHRVTKTFTVPKDAPATDTSRNSYTYVTLQAVLTVKTREGGVDKYQTIIFPASGYNGHIGNVEGSIDDYLYFGELS